MTINGKALIHRGYAELLSSGGSQKCAFVELYISPHFRARRGIEMSLKLFFSAHRRQLQGKAIRNVGKAPGAGSHLPCATATQGALILLERSIDPFSTF